MANVGDIIFIGYNGRATPEEFSFVVMNVLAGNDIIKFTDNAINNAAASEFRTGEYAIQWNVPTSGVPAGAVVVITGWGNGTNPLISFNDGLGGSINSITTVGTLNSGIENQTTGGFNNTGDQIFAYTGTLNSPTLLAGLNASSAPITTGIPNSQTTYAPPLGVPFTNLTGGINGKTLFTSNPGSQSIANLTDPSNFTTSSTTNFIFTDITPDPVFSQPDLTITLSDSPDPVTVGNNLTYSLTISNNNPVNSTGIAVDFTLPTGLSVIGTPGVSNGFTYTGTTGGVAQFTDGSINGNNSATLTVIVTPTTAGTLTSGTAVVDLHNTITETNESNNTAATITTTINAAPGVTITQSSNSTDIAESGVTDSYTIVLSSQPSADVTIHINPDSQTSTNVNHLTFTPANWENPQTVIVSASNDATVEGNHTGTIQHTVNSNDANYNGISINCVTANITDNDTAGVTITQSSSSTDITENGATDSYTIVLNSQPTENVDITINSGSATTTNPTILRFTSANWNLAQTVTVAAVDDAVTEGQHTGIIQHIANSNDANYNGISIDSVTANITDNDTAGVTITQSSSSTDIAERGVTDSYTVVLNSQPTANVDITINSDSETTTNPGVLSFTPADWNSPKTVIVTAIDDATVEGNHSQRISHTASSNDFHYNGISIDSLIANITDNDQISSLILNINPTRFPENAGINAAIGTVTRTGLATSELVVNLRSNDTTEARVPNQVTITAAETSATFVITSVDDWEIDGTQNIVLTAMAEGYNNSTIMVSVTDNDVLASPPISTPISTAIPTAISPSSSPISVCSSGARVTPCSDWVILDPKGETIQTLAGHDTVMGSLGDDRVQGNQDNDSILGGDGNDLLRGGKGSDRLFGEAGDDRIIGDRHADFLDGGTGNDFLLGSQATDTLSGGYGNDTLRGGKNPDSLNGGEGNDWLIGDWGQDTLTGDQGSDTFVLRPDDSTFDPTLADRITDFQAGIDFIGLSDGLTGANLFIEGVMNGCLMRLASTDAILAWVGGVTPNTIRDRFIPVTL